VEILLRCVTRSCVAVLIIASLAKSARAQTSGAEAKAAIAVADSVLTALSHGDRVTLARLVLDSSVVSGAGLPNGVERLSLRTWGLYINRTGPATFTERGFDATARVQDRVAQVWMPYDLYVGDKWSHWRVAALTYTIEQPPSCRKHPSGPPAR